MTVDVEIFPTGTSTSLVKGQSVWVNTDQSEQRSTALPNEQIQRIGELEKWN